MLKTLKLSIYLLVLFTSGHVLANPGTGTRTAQPGSYANIDNVYLERLLKQGITLVDIRRKEEWQQTGIVKGSHTITLFNKNGDIQPDFAPRFTALVKQDEPVILICRTGNRTTFASQAITQQLGYKQVMNVTHGITKWISEGRPVVRYRK